MRKHLYPDRRSAELDLAVRDLKVGADVYCERDEPAKGNWSRYAGRAGRVVSINVEVFPAGRGVYVEVAVRFDHSSSTTWFLPCELRRGYGAYKAPGSRAIDRDGTVTTPLMLDHPGTRR